jgi:hypothetical protein
VSFNYPFVNQWEVHPGEGKTWKLVYVSGGELNPTEQDCWVPQMESQRSGTGEVGKFVNWRGGRRSVGFFVE